MSRTWRPWTSPREAGGDPVDVRFHWVCRFRFRGTVECRGFCRPNRTTFVFDRGAVPGARGNRFGPLYMGARERLAAGSGRGRLRWCGGCGRAVGLPGEGIGEVTERLAGSRPPAGLFLQPRRAESRCPAWR